MYIIHIIYVNLPAIFHQVVFTMSAVNIGFCTFVFSLCVGRTYSRPVPAWIKNVSINSHSHTVVR